MPGDTVIAPEALARAEQALAKLSSNYLIWAEADCASLRAALAELHDHPFDVSDVLWRMFRIAHDLKGQAATFGYPLITEIGRRLCAGIERSQTATPDEIVSLSCHIEAVAEVISRRLEGDGGVDGQEILARLD